jgi:uncharacterized membrane protein HdeD (DUF308 family)
MNKLIPIYLYGAIIIMEGVFTLFSKNTSFNVIKLSLGIGLTFGAILAFIAALSRQRKLVQFAYHEMHALAMIVYGISILLFCNTFDKLISFTAFLLLFYTFSEIIFCNWLFNLGQKVAYKILFVRLILGLSVGIGTVVSMNLYNSTLEGFGVLFIMIGINIILYVPIMQEKEFIER